MIMFYYCCTMEAYKSYSSYKAWSSLSCLYVDSWCEHRVIPHEERSFFYDEGWTYLICWGGWVKSWESQDNFLMGNTVK